jgi:hypothetical protein
MRKTSYTLLRSMLLAGFLLAVSPISHSSGTDGCYSVPVTANTPTGIAGCVVWGQGIASHYGPGNGVAMNFCTWVLRHDTGCGSASITSVTTGRTVVVPIVDFCDCYTGTGDARIVDLQYGVVELLGLPLSQGLYEVIVEPAGVYQVPQEAVGEQASGDDGSNDETSAGVTLLPNTATSTGEGQ